MIYKNYFNVCGINKIQERYDNFQKNRKKLRKIMKELKKYL